MWLDVLLCLFVCVLSSLSLNGIFMFDFMYTPTRNVCLCVLCLSCVFIECYRCTIISLTVSLSVMVCCDSISVYRGVL